VGNLSTRSVSESMFHMEPDIDSEVTMMTSNSPESSYDSYSDIQSSTLHDFSDDSESNLWREVNVQVSVSDINLCWARVHVMYSCIFSGQIQQVFADICQDTDKLYTLHVWVISPIF